MRSSCTWCVRTVNVFRHTNRGVFRVHTSLVLLVLLEFMLCVVAAACHLYEGNQLVLELNSWDPWTGLGLLLKSVVAEHVPGAGKLFGSGITPPQQRRVLALLIALVLPVVCWAAEIALWLLLPYFEVVYHGAAVSQGCFAQPPVNAPHPGRKHCEDAVSFVHRCGTVVVFGRTWSALLACIEYYEGALHTTYAVMWVASVVLVGTYFPAAATAMAMLQLKVLPLLSSPNLVKSLQTFASGVLKCW